MAKDFWQTANQHEAINFWLIHGGPRGGGENADRAPEMDIQFAIQVRGNTREKGGNPEKCVRGFPVLHSDADPGGTSRKTLFLERELGNGRQAAGLRSSRLGWAPRSGWLTGKRVFRLGQAGRNGQLNKIDRSLNLFGILHTVKRLTRFPPLSTARQFFVFEKRGEATPFENGGMT